MQSVQQVLVDPVSGLDGDHYSGKSNRQRQVTLIQEEHLQVIASVVGKSVGPETLRRNLVVGGINLLALKGQAIRIGPAILEVTGLCHPCSRMEEALGRGGYNAMRGHGGITATVIRGGLLSRGDLVFPAQGNLFADNPVTDSW